MIRRINPSFSYHVFRVCTTVLATRVAIYRSQFSSTINCSEERHLIARTQSVLFYHKINYKIG